MSQRIGLISLLLFSSDQLLRIHTDVDILVISDFTVAAVHFSASLILDRDDVHRARV